jgi:hypothetical protein
LSNPFSWAIYLSIGIEIAALSALAAISAQMGKKVYFPFGIVTLIQFIGNIFFHYPIVPFIGNCFPCCNQYSILLRGSKYQSFLDGFWE